MNDLLFIGIVVLFFIISALIGAFMFMNALWNYFFFRTRNLFHAYLLGLPYSAIVFPRTQHRLVDCRAPALRLRRGRSG